jgi:anti-anti-sigma factor
MPPGDQQVQIVHREGDCVVEILTDELMHREAPEMAGLLVDAIAREVHPDQRVVIDFNRVVHMNSNAVSVLLIAKKMLEDRGHAMALTGVSPAIRELFRFMCLEKVLTIIGR